jgi:hypothetical protein
MDFSGVDSNGVDRHVLSRMQDWQELITEYNGPPVHGDAAGDATHLLTINMTVHQRDAEYIVECLRIGILQQEQSIIAQATRLSLDYDEISDGGIDVFGDFLRDTSCHLRALVLWNLPHQQARRLLNSLHANRSVKNLCIADLQGEQVSSWIADLLRHKKDFTNLHLRHCRFPLKQVLPLLRGQSNLKRLEFFNCLIGDKNTFLLFNDPEFTQSFVDHVLLSPPTVKTLLLRHCGVSLENKPLMAGFYKNTTIVELDTDHQDSTIRLFIDPILQRNRYLENVHGMLGTTTTTTRTLPSTTTLLLPTSTLPPENDDDGENIDIATPTTLSPPPCSLWPTVLAKVGRNGTQGSSPVFAILQDRLATWIPPYVYYTPLCAI